MSFIFCIVSLSNLGIIASNLICIFPGRCVLKSGIPCPLMLNVVPGLVPAGTFKLNFLFVGVTISTVDPIIKSNILTTEPKFKVYYEGDTVRIIGYVRPPLSYFNTMGGGAQANSLLNNSLGKICFVS